MSGAKHLRLVASVFVCFAITSPISEIHIRGHADYFAAKITSYLFRNNSIFQIINMKAVLFFFFFWLHWVFVAARRLSLVAESGGYFLLRCAGFSLWWLLLLRSTGSRRAGFSSCGSRALEHRLSSCGARA